MPEVFTFLVIAIFFTIILTLRQHYRDRSTNKAKYTNFTKPKISLPQTDLYLLEQGYIENKKLWNMVSPDNGSTWYIVEHGVSNPRKIKTIEKKYSQILIYPKAWKNLKNYVRKNGPINLRDDRGIFLLRKAGFEVRIRGQNQPQVSI